MTRTGVLAVVAAAAAASLGGVAAIGGRPERPADNGAPAPAAGPRAVVCFGHVDVKRGVVSLYPAHPGRVVEVSAREDEPVAEGRVLLRLDDTLARQRLREAEAALGEARAQLAQAARLPEQHRARLAEQEAAVQAAAHRGQAAARQRDRKRRLSERSIIGPDELAAADEEVAALEALLAVERNKLRELELADPAPAVTRAEQDVEARAARRDQAEQLVRECEVRAPGAGRVLRVAVGVGDYLGPQPRQPALQFCPDGPRVVRVEIDQENAGRVGDPAAGPVAAEIEDDSRGGGTWKGRLVRLSDWYTHRRSVLAEPLQFNDVRTLEGIVEVTSGDRPLRVGQRVRVRLSDRAR
jgi:multidrug resistance efflux pump